MLHRRLCGETAQLDGVDDDALQLVITDMYAAQHTQTWTSIELYDMYHTFGGLMARGYMFTKLISYLGNDVVVVSVDGCASVVGFRDLVGRSFKLVKVESVDEESVNAVVSQVRRESLAIQYSHADYDLGDFTYNNTLKQTSVTLLQLISELVSNGHVTQKSLSLTQAVQGHITGTRNQTTLGLAVKLHHRHGSSELIKLLHDHGFIVTYDEVLRFRKSAAKFVGDKSVELHRAMGLVRRVGPIFGWFDNLDLLVSTPNGRRDTHVMAHEFQQHPAGIIEKGSAEPGVMNLVIPRLMRTVACSRSSSRYVQLDHYTGPKKVNPPSIAMTSGIPYIDVCAREESLKVAEQNDTQWLNSLSSEDSMEWSGFNNQLARKQTPSETKPATVYLVGPLIDAPPAHQDTVLTSMLYMKKSLLDPGTEKIMVFDRYDDISAKDHERVRRGGEGSTDYNLTINSPLPSRDAILKNKHNKLELSRILSTLDMDADMAIDSRYNGGFEHDEADVTMIAYLLQAAESGKSVIRILTDDTDVFVLLVYWVWKNAIAFCSPDGTLEWGGDRYQRDMFVTGFQVSAIARNACHQRLRHCIIHI